MSISEIELTPEMQERLTEKAKQRGMAEKAYVRTVIIRDLSQEEAEQPKHSILELEGLGAEIWKDENGSLLDAQDYVNEMRCEWDHRPLDLFCRAKPSLSFGCQASISAGR